MKISTLLLSLSLPLSLGCGLASALAAPAYTRYPAIRADTVVFTAEGDLWKAPAGGGQAQRLTTHPAAEIYPAISHDGKWLAFSASYEGALEAYVMPFSGGVPKRLSFENSAVQVLGWTIQGEVLVSMQNATGPRAHRIVAAIDPQSMLRRVFPVADANEAVLDDAGQTLYFTRYGLHLTNDNAKKYRGGAHAQLWRYDLQGQGEAQNLFPGDTANNKRPMWWNGRLYFQSDREGTYNLVSSKPDGSERRQLTTHSDWEVRNPSLGDGRIVYQLGGNLQILDLATQTGRALEIDLLSDFDQQRGRQIKAPLEQLSNVQFASKDERLIFTARGHVAIAGINAQRRVEIPIPEGARAHEAVFSHDDKSIYALVDSSGEKEIWKFAADGSGQGQPLTANGDTQRWHIYPSPDGKWLAHTDKRGRLWLLDLASKTNLVIDDAGKAGINRHEELVWSPDGKTLAIVRPDSKQQRLQIGLYDLEKRQLHFVTSDKYESFSPAFSADGHWLYFISNRHFHASVAAPWGDRNMGPFFDKRSGLYALALQPGLRFPFQPDDELNRAAPPTAAVAPNGTADATANDKPGSVPKNNAIASPAIVYAGLNARLYQVPLAPGNYQALASDDKRLYFLEQDGGDTAKFNLKTLAISKAGGQPELFAAAVRSYELAGDRKHVFYRSAANPAAADYVIVEAAAKQPADISKAKVAISDWSFRSDPRKEWRQMFADAWRMHRDYLYDDKMRGVDWLQMRNKYAPLIERIADRDELNDVLSMMVGELSTLHSQIRPGDIRRAVPDGQAAGLGAVLARTAQGYTIEHIYRSEAELPGQHSPLDQPQLDIREGDLITAVNGHAVLEARDISDLLLNQADKQVLLQVKRGQNAERQLIVTPQSAAKQAALSYTDWEQSRSARVQAASGGKIGYLHLRNMVGDDIADFAREFYANIHRDGLIIDVRRNYGGSIDSWIIEKLLRKAWAFWAAPNLQPATNMQQSFRGHLVVLIDELTYSDGETFAAGVQALKLAPLVGKRTAGAGVWLSDENYLADNGMARVAESAQFTVQDGSPMIEGVGVSPDIEVDNLPHASFKGEDAQLETALKILEKKMREQPVKPLVPQTLPGLK